MLSREDRKQAIKDAKERKSLAGAYAVRSTSGTVWVGASRNLNATRNGLWSGLRFGGYPDASLQKEWNALGEAAFEYQILETLKEDVSPLLLWDSLKEKKAYWLAQLNARGLL